MSASPKVPAADQTLRILLLMASSRGPLPASMIANHLELPRSTVYHLLGTLIEHGFVMHLSEEKRYGLGLAAIQLSSAYTRQEPLTRLGIPLMQQLTDRIGLSSHLGVLHGTDILYIVEQRAPRAPLLVSDVDVRLPASLTATGRSILAAMPKAQVRALYPSANAFEQRPGRPHNIDRYSKLRAVLNETLHNGFSLEHEEISAGFSSVGAPVLDHRDWPVAGIAATFITADHDEASYTQIAAEVRATAETLSTRLHGRRS